MNISTELQKLLSNSTIRLRFRHGTAADWTAANPVLLEGEPGFETDTKKEKRGDGVTAWVDLPYESNADDIAAAVSTANSHADAGDTTTLASAKTYSDAKAMPSGGAINQLLVKKSATSYDTKWIDPPPTTDLTALHDKGAWSSVASYAANDIVTYQGKLYKCTSPVVVAAPAISTTPSAAASTSATGGTIALPAGAQSGDLAVLVMNSTGLQNSIAPSGFTVAYAPALVNSCARTYLIKALTAADITAGNITIPNQTGSVYGWAALLWWARGGLALNTAKANPTNNLTTPAVTPSSYPAWTIDIVTGVVMSAPSFAWSGPNPLTVAKTDNATHAFLAGSYQSLSSGASIAATVNATGIGNVTSISIPLEVSTAFQTANFTEIGVVHDSNGRLQAADPAAAGDVATKGYTDSLAGGKLNYRGAWVKGAYNVNDVVTYNNKSYVCKLPVSGGAASYVGGSTQAYSSNSVLNQPLPAGSAAGDLVLVTVSSPNNAPFIQSTSKFTLVKDVSNGVGGHVQLWQYTLTAADITAGTVVMPTGNTNGNTSSLQVFHNVGAIDVANIATALSSTVPVTTMTGAGYLLECGAGTGSTNPTQANLSGFQGWAVFSSSVGSGYETYASPGTTTARTFSGLGSSSPVTMAVPILTGAFPAASFDQIAVGAGAPSQVLATGASHTVDDVIAMLQTLGLVKQS